MTEERIQKLMARAGYGSRRACEKIIEQGRVRVNDKRVTLGMKADPSVDVVRVDDEEISLPDSFVYIILNKPKNVISDEDVKGNLSSARELIPVGGHLYPVGRLDLKSEGLLLFTNDGELANRMTHPRYEHPKIYHVLVDGVPSDRTLDLWRNGIPLDGKKTVPAVVKRQHPVKGGMWLEITLREGRKRIIRRVAAALGHPVHVLRRIQIGPIKLGSLPVGAWRQLNAEEIAELQKVRVAKAKKRRTYHKKPSASGRKDSPSSKPKQGRRRRSSKR